jgi:cephalosporin hydroxylase
MTTMESSPFSRIAWEDDRARVGRVTFLVQGFGEPSREPDDNAEPCFVLYKNPHVIGLYDAFFRSVPDFQPRHVFEIGIWRAGSAVLFVELFEPDKLVAIDLGQKTRMGPGTLRHLEAWFKGRGDQAKQTQLYWEVDQADVRQLRDLARRELMGTVDFVVDDASHFYTPTCRSFDALFPYVRPGGWYAIEDWSWSYEAIFQDPRHPWALTASPARLITDLVAVAGQHPTLIPAIRIAGQIAFVQRGSDELDDTFTLARYVPRERPGRLAVHARRALWRVGSQVARLIGPRPTLDSADHSA